jgi:hypothetical protein
MRVLFKVLLARSRWKRFQPIFYFRQTSARDGSSHGDNIDSSRSRTKPGLARRYAVARNSSLSLGVLATNDFASDANADNCQTARLFRNASAICSRGDNEEF